MTDAPNAVEHDEEIQEDLELTEFLNKQGEDTRKMATKKTNAYIKKHKKEISRLRKLAEKSLIDDNKDSYCYAIKKMRAIIGKPIPNDVMDMMWKTSRQEIINIITNFTESKGELISKKPLPPVTDA